LETEIAGLAAERMGVGDLADLAVVVRRMEITVDDTEPWLEADLAFHLALMRGAKNALLAHLVGALTDVMRLSIRAMGKQTDLRDTKATLARHVAIFDAVRARDPEAARRAMAAHFDATRPVVDAIIADRGRTQGIGLDDALEGGK
jgi:GntR family transcriptional repressor for pyruvate dehydrogenase complex